jgi:AraC-like DNA-binding protein
MRAVCAASVEGALPAVVSHEPTLRTAPVDTRDHCVRADSQISKNRKNQRQGWPMSAQTLAGGRYRVERELGHGGMASVFLAHDEELDRPVAVKVLAAHLASEPGLAPTVVCGAGGRRTSPDGADLGDALSLGTRTWGNHADGTTLLIMGCYQLRGEISRQVLSALPQQIVLEPETWQSPLVPLLDEELVTDVPGQPAVLDRLFDLLLVSVVRAWFNQPGNVAPGWYRAHRDPVVGHALRLLQQEPARSWTVARLAAETGTSRSALARSFTELVGVPPMTYLKQWRLARAADLLLDRGLTLDAIARRVGYSDGPTLSSVFKGARGVSPRQYREAASPPG